jgi:hypothetical protein
MSEANANGRSLEYLLVEGLLAKGVTPSGATRRYQLRDAASFSSRPRSLQARFENAVPRIVTWMSRQAGSLDGVSVLRMGDQSGDVADLVLVRGGSSCLRISLKYNHRALKHPRPYSFAQACGIAKGDQRDRVHRERMAAVSEPLKELARRTGRTLFQDHQTETRLAYEQVVKVCSESLARWCVGNCGVVASNLSRFMVGEGFHKIIVGRNECDGILMEDYTTVMQVSRVSSTPAGAYLMLVFDNGYRIKLRIHSAASEISTSVRSQLSLKFDAQMEGGGPPAVVI